MALSAPKRSTWQLQEAKNRLSEVVRRAREEGPQTITVRGDPTVVVLSTAEYERLKPPAKGMSLLEALRPAGGPNFDLDIPRDYDDRLREIEW